MQFFAYTPYSLGVYSTPPPLLNMMSIYIYCVHLYMNLQMMSILASDMTI